MRILVCVLATRLRPGGYSHDEATRGSDQSVVWGRKYARDEQADGGASAGKDEADAQLAQSTRKPCSLVVLFVYDGYEEQKERKQYANHRDEEREAREPRCQLTSAWVRRVGAMTRTWPDFPFRLKRSDAGEAAHSKEVEERLGRMEYDSRL